LCQLLQLALVRRSHQYDVSTVHKLRSGQSAQAVEEGPSMGLRHQKGRVGAER